LLQSGAKFAEPARDSRKIARRTFEEAGRTRWQLKSERGGLSVRRNLAVKQQPFNS
jgi:hypothetical protein